MSLADHFPNLKNITEIQEPWNDFIQLETVLHSKYVSTDEAEQFGKDAKKWVAKFTSIYQSKHVTPYLHIFAMHLSELLIKQKNLVIFTQQGLEKLNDQTTIDFTKSANHNYRNLDALKQILSKRNRIELLQDDGYQRAKK